MRWFDSKKTFGYWWRMQKKVSYRLGLFMVLWSVWSAVAWSGSNICPVHTTQSKTTLDSSKKEEIPAEGKIYSVPRNQVLLEIATGTW